MPHILEGMSSADFPIRKMSIDTLFTLVKTTNPVAVKPFVAPLFEKLLELRFDKIKPVRDSSLEALNAMKEAPELEINEDMIGKPNDEKRQTKQKKQEPDQEKKPLVKRNPKIIENLDPEPLPVGKGSRWVIRDPSPDQDHQSKERQVPAVDPRDDKKVTPATQKRQQAK